MKVAKIAFFGLSVFLGSMSEISFAEPKTSDLDFLIGTWKIEARLSPGTEREVQENGTRTCSYTMGEAYIVCRDEVERTMGGEKLNPRIGYNYHNYNAIYEVYESIFLNSNWPIKPIANFTIQEAGENLVMESVITFSLPGEQIETVKTTYIFDGQSIVAEQYIHVSDQPEGEWRYNFWERAEKITE